MPIVGLWLYYDRSCPRITFANYANYGITRASSIKILGVTISNKLSVTDHVTNVIGGCAPILHALRVLRAHGMCDTALNSVYQAVVIAKLTYAASAWWGFLLTASALKPLYAEVFAVVSVAVTIELFSSSWRNPISRCSNVF